MSTNAFRGEGSGRGGRGGGKRGNIRGNGRGRGFHKGNWNNRGDPEQDTSDFHFPDLMEANSQNTSKRGKQRGNGVFDRAHRGNGRYRVQNEELNGAGAVDENEFDDDDDLENETEVPKKVARKRERKHEGPVFGFKRLYRFLETSPDEVLMSINRDKEDWKTLLESVELEGEKLILAIEVISEKVCVESTELLQLQSTSLTACCSKPFAKKLEDALPKICTNTYVPRRRNPNTEFPIDSNPMKVMDNIYRFCSFVIKTQPHNAVDYFHVLVCTAIGASLQCDSSQELFKKFKSLSDQIQEAIQNIEKKKETVKRRKIYGFNEDDMQEFDSEQPPDNIKDIAIIPNIEELRLVSEPFLRPNKRAGAYNDSDHYIDVQFRLLREDFVQPLRKGIRTFLKEKHEFISRKKRMPLGEVRLYTEVTINQIVKERDSVVYKLQLAEYNFKRIRWEKSKRLLIGSLVLLTPTDNSFQLDNTHFGIVFSRNIKELEKGLVSVSWEGTPPAYNEEEEYLMFESEVYLEAYRYTLETLKSLNLATFPMKKFIVDACSTVDYPNYLKNATNLLQLKLQDGGDICISPQQWQWPSAAEFGLDENQMQAFRAALTKEFSIIQGPPGTGKTFLGLKVAEVFLRNYELWKGENDNRNPITVVCYTNHALDQFLEGILKFYERENKQPEIIRIGGRCKSDALAPFALREVRNRNRKRLPHHYWTNERLAKERIYELEEKRASQMNEVIGLQDLRGIVDFERLSCWNRFQPNYPKVLWQCFQNLNWFGIGDESLKERYSEEAVTAKIHDWFRIRAFPKFQKKKKKENDPKKTEFRIEAQDPAEDELEDEEDFDMDELLEHRLVDDILLQAETSQQVNMGKHISYLPDASIAACEKSHKYINKLLRESTRGLNQAQTFQARESKAGDLLKLENRKKFLEEICRLHKEQLFDLPANTEEVLQEIRQNGPAINHLSRLRMSERWALYFAVVDQARQSIAEKVAETENELGIAQKELRNVMQYNDGLILKGCQVVGLTTTGAAKYNNLLRMMKSKIVIVEEAAEVFEAHIVTCITENCEQLILIGDHRQLRPSPTVYDLATKFNLDLSLFERMLNNNLHCYQLKMQHRMRPDISDLVVGPIYEELYNHDSVKLYPDVKGISKNVFFLTHMEKESADADSTSKSNKHEAQFLSALCRYLILQGYKPDQITVLTMYTGQMFLLKKEIGSTGTCKGVRVTCVDNFQGEENDIILLSLVRSNSEGNIGFLKIDNRICVSLSRAKHGLYIIGNIDQMVEKSKTWRLIREKLDAQDAVGESLELECQNHRTRALVKTCKDFSNYAPEGGCTILCDTILSCSHKCPKVCHVLDKDHQQHKCREPCLKKCANNKHPCKAKCFEQCPPCMAREEKTLTCELQHKKLLPCHKSVDGVICFEQVEKTLPCAHKEVLACHISIHDFICKVKVSKQLGCGHSKLLECHVDPATKRCFTEVTKTLPCGHTQSAECWLAPENVKCTTLVDNKFEKCGHEIQVKCHEKHSPHVCKGKCTVRLGCGHACVKICHVDNDPEHLLYECKKDCERDCQDGHRCVARHPCFKKCPPCKAKILRTLPCGHQKELECHVDINTYECLEVCERLLPDLNCRHKCPNLCFAPCGPCQTNVRKLAPCGHIQTVLCGETPKKENCMELVRPRITPVCGHSHTTVPCKYDSSSPEEVAKHCQKACNHEFTLAAGAGCGHRCQGTCSTCLMGRIHMKCQNECGRQLVCGHVCEVPCSTVCPPCEKPCMMKCEHSACKMKCGEPCSECKENCGWVCAHMKCTKLCGEMCDREPCNEPCRKKLKCSHDCVGFCGEPCPPLCRICDKDELTTIFLGGEEEEDARFVYLEDCKHTIEAEGLEEWVKVSNGGKISAKCCPKCRTTIRNCRRFGNVIKQHYKDVTEVKKRAFGNIANSKRMRDGWIAKLNNDESSMGRIFPRLHQQLRDHMVTEVQLKHGVRLIPKTINEFAMRSLDFVANSASKISKDLFDLNKQNKLISPCWEKVLTIYRKTFGSMIERHPLSRQEVLDFNEELDRLDYFKQLMMRRCLANCSPAYPAAYTIYHNAKDIITSTLPFTYDRRDRFKHILKDLDDKLRSGLGITDRERLEILRAMGQGQGHWFKCPNGHIYVITECGGAMQESKCNECGARIGGSSHRLRHDNQLAREMDGASSSAWPTALQR